jgi:hypothetical protein
MRLHRVSRQRRPARVASTACPPEVGTEGSFTAALKPRYRGCFIALVDTANGIAVRHSPQDWMFPNVDLTVHLHRQPTGSWVGLDTTVIFGPAGHGMTSTVLHDILGPVGQATQTLTLRPLI